MAAPKVEVKSAPERAGLSFTEKKRLEALPGIMERLEAEIAKLNEFLAHPDLFQTAPAKVCHHPMRAGEGAERAMG